MIEEPVTVEPRGQRGDDATVARIAATQAELAQVCGLVNASQARLVELVAGLLRTGDWSQGGINSPEHYLMWQCALSRGDARRVLRVARRLGAYRSCAAAFEAGELSLAQVDIICRHRPPQWAEKQVCGHAKLMTIQQLEHVLAQYAFDGAEPEVGGATEGEDEAASAANPPPGPEPEPEVREVRLGTTAAGGLRLDAELPIDEGAEVRQALVGCRERLFHQAHPDAEEGARPSDVSWADAMVEMARRAMDWDAATHPRSNRHRVLWHHHIDPAGRPVLRAHKGGRVPEWLRRLLLCDSDLVPVTEITPHTHGAKTVLTGTTTLPPTALRPDGSLDRELLAKLAGGVPVSVGRARRIAPDRLRVLIEHRDGCCRVPGCTNKYWLHIHHIKYWEDGGLTVTWNLIAVCHTHHRAIHRGDLHITGNADDPFGLTFTDRDGRPIRTGARAAPPTDPHDQAAAKVGIKPGTWRHPLGEKLQYDNIYYTGNPREAAQIQAAVAANQAMRQAITRTAERCKRSDERRAS